MRARRVASAIKSYANRIREGFVCAGAERILFSRAYYTLAVAAVAAASTAAAFEQFVCDLLGAVPAPPPICITFNPAHLYNYINYSSTPSRLALAGFGLLALGAWVGCTSAPRRSRHFRNVRVPATPLAQPPLLPLLACIIHGQYGLRHNLQFLTPVFTPVSAFSSRAYACACVCFTCTLTSHWHSHIRTHARTQMFAVVRISV